MKSGEFVRYLIITTTQTTKKLRLSPKFEELIVHRYERRGDKVIAFFQDGSEVEGDILVGADGNNSVVRQQLLPSNKLTRTGFVSILGKAKYPSMSPF